MAEEQNRTLNDKFMLRLPDGMRDRLKSAAEANGRSMNAEIVTRVQQTFDVDERWPNLPPKVVEMLRHREEANAHRTSLDEIATATMKEIAAQPGLLGAKGLDRITSKYEELKRQETRGVRDFMETVQAVMQTISGRTEGDE